MMAPRVSATNGLKRTISDISAISAANGQKEEVKSAAELPPISEVEETKCECCGMSEEYTTEYVSRVRKKYLGKWICGLCAEAVKEEAAKKEGMELEEALNNHMSFCVRFNKFGRAYPVLYQAEAMREMLKRSAWNGNKAKSFGAREKAGGGLMKAGGRPIGRSSSCIPAITRDVNELKIARS